MAVGVSAMLFWHIVINMGMVIGLFPVVGVPLPFFSYGGTSMVTSMVGGRDPPQYQHAPFHVLA